MSKPIESYPDAKHCELCGALVTKDGADHLLERDAVAAIRQLAFLIDVSPSIITLLMHCVAGRTRREIAARLGISRQAVCKRLKCAKQALAGINHPKNHTPLDAAG